MSIQYHGTTELLPTENPNKTGIFFSDSDDVVFNYKVTYNDSLLEAVKLLKHAMRKLQRYENGDIPADFQETHPVRLSEHIKKFLENINEEVS